jgi:hypothetical protein
MESAAFITSPSPLAARTIECTLARFGAGALAVAGNAGVRIVVLESGRGYRDASAALRRLGAGVDEWPAPPAGLFVVEERTMYLRTCSPMTIAHEFGHALDCALGGGVYRSTTDGAIRGAFAAATAFVTPYAASAVDEYFAEAMRAWVGVNDVRSLWPRATRERLTTLDPTIAGIVSTIFAAELAAPDREPPP